MYNETKIALAHKKLNGDLSNLANSYHEKHCSIIINKHGFYYGTITPKINFNSPAFDFVCSISDFKTYCLDVKQSK